MPTDSSFSFVIPVYNSEGTLETLVHRVTAVADRLTRPFEIVLVNDGRDRRRQP